MIFSRSSIFLLPCLAPEVRLSLTCNLHRGCGKSVTQVNSLMFSIGVFYEGNPAFRRINPSAARGCCTHELRSEQYRTWETIQHVAHRSPGLRSLVALPSHTARGRMRYPIMSLDDNSRFESALPASVESGRDDVVAKSGTITATPLVRAIGNKPCRAAMCASHDRPVRPQSTPSDPPQSPEKPTRAQAADLRIEALGSRVACYIVRPSRHSASLIAGQGLSCAATSIQYRTADVTRIRAVVGRSGFAMPVALHLRWRAGSAGYFAALHAETNEVAQGNAGRLQ